MCDVNKGWSVEWKIRFDWDMFYYKLEKGMIEDLKIEDGVMEYTEVTEKSNP